MTAREKIGHWLFRNRSFTPVPFALAVLVFARPTAASMVGGGLLVVLGELVRLWAVSLTGSETRTTGSVGGSRLVTAGPYAYVRNPLYLGNIAIYVGLGVMSLALFPWLTIAGWLWFQMQYSLIIEADERHLGVVFAESYERYRSEVPRFLPRLTPYRAQGEPAGELNVRAGLRSERSGLIPVGLMAALLILRMALHQ